MSNTGAGVPLLDSNSSRDLRDLNEGSFTFRTLEDVHRIASLLAGLCPVPHEAEIGISELMVNAVEHGNLGISSSEKSKLKREDQWLQEIAHRLTTAERSQLAAHISFRREAKQLVFCIEDEGKGFEWHKFLEIDPERCLQMNGRGIALARKISFDSLVYEGCGNRVIATICLTKDAA